MMMINTNNNDGDNVFDNFYFLFALL